MGAVAVIDADPDLAEGLSNGEREAARRRLVAPAFDLQPGPWVPGAGGERAGHGVLGMLVLSGLLTRAIALEGRTTGELVGLGDVLRPWIGEDGPPGVAFTVTWTVHAPTRLALLDRRFVAAAARWPSVLEEIAERAVRRTNGLSLQLALGQVPRIEGRLLLIFWRLGERWGRVTPDGIVIPVRLTHETLASLVAARRPSVTSALGRLSDAQLLVRRDAGWLLRRAAEEHLAEFLVARDTPPPRTLRRGRAPAASGPPAR